MSRYDNLLSSFLISRGSISIFHSLPASWSLDRTILLYLLFIVAKPLSTVYFHYLPRVKDMAYILIHEELLKVYVFRLLFFLQVDP